MQRRVRRRAASHTYHRLHVTTTVSLRHVITAAAIMMAFAGVMYFMVEKKGVT